MVTWSVRVNPVDICVEDLYSTCAPLVRKYARNAAKNGTDSSNHLYFNRTLKRTIKSNGESFNYLVIYIQKYRIYITFMYNF